MKKYIAIIFVISICLSAVSCSGEVNKPTETSTNPANNQSSEIIQETESPTKATEIPTEKPTETKKDDAWKKLYINQLNSLNKDEFSGFCLVQIDGDSIPELYAESVSHMANSYLYWVYENKLCEYSMFYDGLSYIEYKNLFMNSGGFQGCCFDDVLSLERSTTKQIAHGDYVLEEIAGEESYEWNSVEVSQSEYENFKNSAFDMNSATQPNTFYSYSDICKQITEW